MYMKGIINEYYVIDVQGGVYADISHQLVYIYRRYAVSLA